MGVELSVIVQEHNESRDFLRKMLDQTAQLPYNKEVLCVTSIPFRDFYTKFGPFDQYKFPVSVIGNIQSCGAARNVGGSAASGDALLFMDAHVCFTPSAVARLLQTLDDNPDAVVAPALQPVEFPSCIPVGGRAHGVAFRFTEGKPFEWVWLPGETEEHEFTVPFVCGCAFSMKKSTFDVLNGIGGFLSGHQGLSFEEEITMRLWRMGNPTYSEPRAVFGHLFKGYEGHPTWDAHSVSGYHMTRMAGLYVNVFDKDLWNQIEPVLIKSWGDEYFKNLEWAKINFSWIRNLMKPHAGKLDERWFFRTQ